VKPSLSRLGCRRLGQQASGSGGRSRKLLVHLTSEEAAKDLLREAPKLRNSTDTANIYINPDLTPAEAALAYQRRQRRRNAAASRETDGITPATQQVAQSIDKSLLIHRAGDNVLQAATSQSTYSPTLTLSAAKTTISSPIGPPFPAM